MALGDTYRPGNFISGALPELPNATFSGDRLSGNGAPEGVVPANPGQTYVDLISLQLWQKQAGTQTVGWRLIGIAPASGGGGGGGGGGGAVQVFSGTALDPNGVVTTSAPAIYYSLTDLSQWNKVNIGTNSTGWTKVLG